MRNTYPIFCVTWHDGEADNFKGFETFDEAEQFMDYAENCGWTIVSLEKI